MIAYAAWRIAARRHCVKISILRSPIWSPLLFNRRHRGAIDKTPAVNPSRPTMPKLQKPAESQLCLRFPDSPAASGERFPGGELRPARRAPGRSAECLVLVSFLIGPQDSVHAGSGLPLPCLRNHSSTLDQRAMSRSPCGGRHQACLRPVDPSGAASGSSATALAMSSSVIASSAAKSCGLASVVLLQPSRARYVSFLGHLLSLR